MTNIEMKVEGEILTIKVDLSEKHGHSKSGKNQTVATTAGIVSVPGREEVKIGVNVFTK